MKIKELMESLTNEDLIKIVKIYINNPFIDLLNAILLFKNGLSENEKLIRYDEMINKYVYMFLNKNNETLELFLSSTAMNKKVISLDYKEVCYIFKNLANIEVKLNKEIDISKKDKFIKNNTLYISNTLTIEKRCLLIIKEYVSILLKEFNNIGVLQLVDTMIDYSFDNKEIEFTKIVTLETIDNKINMLNIAFSVYYEIITNFTKKFLKLNNLLEIDNAKNDTEISNLELNISKEKILEIKNNINNGNLPDYPYYYL